NAAVDQGLRAALGSDPPVHVFYEFLDSPVFGGEAHERAVIAYLRAKYESRPPDVLVAFNDAAYAFLAIYRRQLFPGRPLVYGNVAPAVLRLHLAADDVLGVPVEYDFAGTIAEALRLHPGADRLVVVTGTSSRDREWEARLRQEAPPLAGKHRVEFWAGLATDVLVERLAKTDARTVVFTVGYFVDGAGALSTPRDAAARLAQASAAPVYGPLDTFIGTGVVGGRMASFEGIGRQAGTLVASLLRGAPPASLERPGPAPVALHVDWRQVKRFGIDEDVIPKEAVVHYREPTFWEQYRGVALLWTTVILLQAALIAALLIERRRRRAAEVVTQEQRVELAHASRLAVAGELTASIAHEINQPLGAVQTSADAADLLLQSDADTRDDLRRIVTRIRRDSVRAGDVIRRLRSLLARHAPEQRPFGLDAAVDDVVTLMSPEARRRGVLLQRRSGTGTGRVLGDQTQIQQVLINLVLNAMDAVAEVEPERRIVTVTTDAAGGQARVTVSDHGKGIAPDAMPKLFDSFYSTKPAGMGLGLSIARTIVEAHGGRLGAANNAGEGASFQVELPRLRDTPVAQAGAA
ncbi:MAG: GHKL domain-containing protein, partial [Burkholderiales bacterium]|nr:GHKL domain-containing protein [Burkholderiales bacterium]